MREEFQRMWLVDWKSWYHSLLDSSGRMSESGVKNQMGQ